MNTLKIGITKDWTKEFGKVATGTLWEIDVEIGGVDILETEKV